MGGRFEPQDVVAEYHDRAVLVGADLGARGWPLEESLAELSRLAETAGAEVVASVSQRLQRPHPKTFIGEGKAEEIAQIVRDLSATVVVFDENLSPSQQANLETLIPNTKVVDRTALILDIFALHAVSREGKLQVELAQMEYLLPRLRGMWRHFEQAAAAAGGKRGIGTRGPGETQLETDRRLVRNRIADLKRELKDVARNRQVQRKARSDSGVYRVAIVGYTNAGKSTLLNALTGAGVLAADMLFATLDSTTRRLDLHDGRTVTLTDTVGFLHKLPHGLVEAFKSTLDEVGEADLLLHVVDASHPEHRAQMAAVRVVLGEIGASGKPQLVVYNKLDALAPEAADRIRASERDAILVSAVTGQGVEELVTRISAETTRGFVTMTLHVPFTRGEVVQVAHDLAHVVSETHDETGTWLVVRAPEALVERFGEFVASREESA